MLCKGLDNSPDKTTDHIGYDE